MKKILHIGQGTGGVKTYIALSMENVAQDNYQMIMIAPPDALFEQFCHNRSIPYYYVDLHRGFNPVTIISGIIKIIQVIHKEQPDIIHTHSAKGGFLGRLAAKMTNSKNVLYTPHAFSYLSFTGLKRVVFFMLELLAKNWTDLLLAISHSEADRAELELGYKKSSIKLVLNSVCVPATKPAFTSRYPPVKVRMIGRLTKQKNHILFLKIANVIMKRHNNVSFSILGAGIHDDLYEEIQDYMFKNNLIDKIKIEKWGDVNTSCKFIEDTDIYVMTSLFEGLPYSLLEAMAMGKPCVVSAVDGNRDVINNGENGFTCFNADDFCERLESLINDEELRKKIGSAGYEYVLKNHNIINNALKLEKIYNDLI